MSDLLGSPLASERCTCFVQKKKKKKEEKKKKETVSRSILTRKCYFVIESNPVFFYFTARVSGARCTEQLSVSERFESKRSGGRQMNPLLGLEWRRERDLVTLLKRRRTELQERR